MKRATSWTSPLVPGDGDPRHGLNGYSNLGCRCEVCREANVADNKRARAVRTARLASGEIEREHGKYTTYANYGCRCSACRAVNARYARSRAAR